MSYKYRLLHALIKQITLINFLQPCAITSCLRNREKLCVSVAIIIFFNNKKIFSLFLSALNQIARKIQGFSQLNQTLDAIDTIQLGKIKFKSVHYRQNR